MAAEANGSNRSPGGEDAYGPYDYAAMMAAGGDSASERPPEEELEELRLRFEQEQDFLEAQKAVLALKKLQIREGNRRRLNMQQIYEEHREAVADHQKQELESVKEEWEERRREFRQALQQELLGMKERHKLAMREEEIAFFQKTRQHLRALLTRGHQHAVRFWIG
eukprot:EC795362.1.p1 GENE.EC795362.1~~EC795362.1.p1  ORF type:complete len:166 (+),score=53.86 EC795362.1:77-574(+)